MSEEQQWIDEAIRPLSRFPGAALRVSSFLRICEAIGRGTPEQGAQLVNAILDLMESARNDAQQVGQ